MAILSVVSAAVAMKASVFWSTTIVALAITWVSTPILETILGFVLTKSMDGVMGRTSEKTKKIVGYLLIMVCCYAAYTLGCSNTGNAVGVFFGTGAIRSKVLAGFIGGIVMAIGALTWGRPLLEKVGLHIVSLDLNSALGAQLAHGIMAHIAASMGYPTSMNQAMIGGMAGAGLARGIKAIDLKAIKEIVISWFLTPLVGGIVSFTLCVIFSRLLGAQ